MFGAINLTKNSDIDKYKCSGYAIGSDAKGTFSHPTGSFAQNVIIFGADLNSSKHANNRTKNILVLGKDFVQGIDGTKIYAEKTHSLNFSESRSKFCLSLHYDGDNSYLFVNGKEIIKFKAKDSKIVANPLCLGNISKDFSERNIRKIVWSCSLL